ncbi:unnamed protein product [Bursaphelenchus xylophilus]|uniref:DNA replication complex GINS protein PSF3 n=1 Tax=Bursaphelenchus xylophilus TaxID=6326 RepID=A0A1I7RTQ3_BURXY|nr:unnamed protein product [Bursaphelenchus xylophilus]CAG9122222.1 unnamed protein product [Bursaphelenchus xylophilus]
MGTNALRREANARYNKWKMDNAIWVEEDYLDLDDIIASHTHVQCLLGPQTTKEVLPYAQIHPNTTIPPRGIKGNISVWLLKDLPFAELVMPTTYTAASKQILQAGPWVLNFETDKRFFYELGLHIADVLRNDGRNHHAQELIKVLRDTYVARQKRIFPLTVDKDSRPTKLSQLEARLFFKGQYSESRFKEWWSGIPKEKKNIKKRFKRE